MKDNLITALLVAGLNLPVYLELYKHVLKDKSRAFTAVFSLVYWLVAAGTQTAAAFVGVLYMYISVYRRIEIEEEIRRTDIWHISFSDAFISFGLSAIARFVILGLNLIYIIILVQLTDYNIKAQDIVTYYSQSGFWLKAILAVDIVVVAPIIEEYVFRYFLYDKVFVARMPRVIAAVFSSLLFTILHFNISGIPTFFGLGLFCTLLYERKGYWSAVTAHATANLITLLFL